MDTMYLADLAQLFLYSILSHSNYFPKKKVNVHVACLYMTL